MIFLTSIFFGLGIVGQQLLNFGFWYLAFILFVSFFVCLILWRQRFWSKIILFGVLAFVFGALRFFIFDTTPDKLLLEKVGQKIEVEGRVVDEPDKRDLNTRYTIKPEIGESKILVIANRFPELFYGAKIKIVGKIVLPQNFENENGIEFDYRSFLAKDKIHFLVWYPEIEILENNKTGFFNFMYDIKNGFNRKISEFVLEPNVSLVSGLLFGSKQSLGSDLLLKFKEVGLIHIIVLSGYNITIIASAIFYLSSKISFRNLGFIFSVVFMFAFISMVGFTATIIRAFIMAMLAILARFLGRPASALRWLFIAGVSMLLWNPYLLLGDPSFQLSFMATLGLIVFTPVVSQKLNFITEQFHFREIVSSTLAVQLFLLPLLIKMSGSFSAISFIVNPLVLPFVPYLMFSGFITGLVGFVPLFGKFLIWLPSTFVFILSEYIIKMTEWFSAFPMLDIKLNTTIIFVWYAFYAYLYSRFHKRYL